MPKFTHNKATYEVQNGILYERTGNIWSYSPYPDGQLRIKAMNNGYEGDIHEKLICAGFHSHAKNQYKH